MIIMYISMLLLSTDDTVSHKIDSEESERNYTLGGCASVKCLKPTSHHFSRLDPMVFGLLDGKILPIQGPSIPNMLLSNFCLLLHLAFCGAQFSANATPSQSALLSKPSDFAQCLENCVETLDFACPPSEPTDNALSCLCAHESSGSVGLMSECLDQNCDNSPDSKLFIENPLLLCGSSIADPGSAGALHYSKNGSLVTDIATVTVTAKVTNSAGSTVGILAPLYSAEWVVSTTSTAIRNGTETSRSGSGVVSSAKPTSSSTSVNSEATSSTGATATKASNDAAGVRIGQSQPWRAVLLLMAGPLAMMM